MFRSIIMALILFSCNDHSVKTTETKKDTIAANKIAETVSKKDTGLIPIFNTTSQPIKLHPVHIVLAKGDSFFLNIPEGYNLNIAAEGMKRLRFLTKNTDGRLFATDMYDKSDNHNGRVLIFENWNDTSKKFEKITTFLDDLHNPNQVAFYKGYIYVAETDKLTRFAYSAGESKPADTGQVLINFPAYGLSYKYGGWHLTRSIAFHHDKLYVSIGSSCNACVEKEEIRASVLEMNPDGSDVKYFARGLRNSVGLKWIGDELWGTGMGRDLIGADKPEDLFQKIERDGYYGWPFYFQFKQKVYQDDQFKDSVKASWVIKPPVAFLGFKAHSAPLGFDHFANFDDDVLKNSVLVCLHGSTSVWRQRGNAIVKVEEKNNYTEIISGFLTGKSEAERHGRPCDILMKDDHSFFFTDDLKGVLYYIWK